MRKIFIFLFAVVIGMPAYAGVGRADNREYVDWSQPPYNKIVYFEHFFYAGENTWSGPGTCTAQYVAPDIILTARHCITSDDAFDNYKLLENNEDIYKITRYDGKATFVKLEKYGYDTVSADWALFRITDSNLFSNDYFDVAPQTEYTTIDNAGFGYMRILSDDDIKKLRKIISKRQIEKDTNELLAADDINVENKILKHMELNGFKKLSTNKKLERLAFGSLKTKLEKEGISPLSDIDQSTKMYRLKAHRGCRFVKQSLNQTILKHLDIAWNLDSVAESTCDTFQGNSGGAYFMNNTLFGICSWGNSTFNNTFDRDHATKTELFYDALQEMKRTSPTMQNNGVIMGTVNNNVQPDMPDDAVVDTTATENRIQEIETELTPQLDKIDSMSDREFVVFLDRLTEYQVLVENYNRAREKQQSLANKTLTALTVAATGIGGMMLASGLAEQKADKEAEADMSTYLNSFRCDYGMGQNTMGGAENIELPGINALTQTFTEYAQLASSLKERKEALGLPPGIESELVLDAANTGLYQNASLGITGGNYASISRALQNPDGDDAEQIADQKKASKTKTTAGGVVGGVGLVGGAVGNAIINRDKK